MRIDKLLAMNKYVFLVVSVMLLKTAFTQHTGSSARLSNREYAAFNNAIGISPGGKKEHSEIKVSFPGDSAVASDITNSLRITTDRKSSSRVSIKWITSSEKNNRGFYIQRKIGNEWKNIAFIFSAADSGNSTSELAYEYRDTNSQKRITNYRLQQIDIHGVVSYSEIFTVSGNGTK